MEKLLYYLNEKNKFYTKFYLLTEKFLKQIEDENYDNIEYFTSSREKLLSIILGLDKKISNFIASMTESAQDSYRDEIKKIFQEREVIGQKIIAQDLNLIQKIDSLKTQTIQELKKTYQSKDTLSSYKSTLPKI